MAEIIYYRPDQEPFRSNFDNEDEYQNAKEKYNKDFDKYVEQIKRDFPDLIEEDED